MEILTLKEAAEYLKLHPDTVKRLAQKGEIKGRRVGRGKNAVWRFDKNELWESLIANQKPPETRAKKRRGAPLKTVS